MSKPRLAGVPTNQGRQWVQEIHARQRHVCVYPGIHFASDYQGAVGYVFSSVATSPSGCYAYIASFVDWMEWQMPILDPGTYDLRVSHHTGPAKGRYNIYVDGVLQGAVVDTYAAAAGVALASRTFSVVSFGARYRPLVRIVASTKNAASTSERVEILRIALDRQPG